MALALLLAAALWCQAYAQPPASFAKQYVGYQPNSIDVEFLPNGMMLVVGRLGYISISNPANTPIQSFNYLDLSNYLDGSGEKVLFDTS